MIKKNELLIIFFMMFMSLSSFGATCKDVMNRDLSLINPEAISKEIPELFGVAEWAPENLVILRHDQYQGKPRQDVLRIEIEHTGYEVENGEITSRHGGLGYLREIPVTSPLFGTTLNSKQAVTLDRNSSVRLIVSESGNTYKIYDERLIVETEKTTGKKRLFVFDEFYSISGRGMNRVSNSFESLNAKSGIGVINIGDSAFFVTPDLQLVHLGSIGKFHSWSPDSKFAVFSLGSKVAVVKTEGEFTVKFVDVGDANLNLQEGYFIKSISVENKRVLGFKTEEQVLKLEYTTQGNGIIDPGTFLFAQIFLTSKPKIQTQTVSLTDLFLVNK